MRNGYKIVNFIHDEVLLEVDREGLHENVLRAQQIMVDAMKFILPDVRIGTEAAAMTHWYKGAKPLFDEHGKLTLWVP